MPRNYKRKLGGRPNKPPKTRGVKGRPEKHSPQMFTRIVSLARLGWTMDAIAKMCEIDRDSIYIWMKRFPEFFGRVRDAKTYFDEKGSDAIDFLLQKQTLKKRKITKTIENGKEVTKTEIVEEEIAPNASVAIRHMSRTPLYKQESAVDAKGSFARAFEAYYGFEGEETAPNEPAVTEAANEPFKEQLED